MKTLKVLLFTIVLFTSSPSLFSTKVSAENLSPFAPEVMTLDYQETVITPLIVNSPDLVGRHIGNVFPVRNLNGEAFRPLKVGAAERFRINSETFVRLNIKRDLPSGAKVVLSRGDESWVLALKPYSIFRLQAGKYSIHFEGFSTDSEEIPFELLEVEFPFLGSVGILDPVHKLTIEEVSRYVELGGVLIVYNNEELFDYLEIPTRQFTYEYNRDSLFGLRWEGQSIQYLDYKAIHDSINLYTYLSGVEANTDMPDVRSLALYVSRGEGGFLAVSNSLMALDETKIKIAFNAIGLILFPKTGIVQDLFLDTLIIFAVLGSISLFIFIMFRKELLTYGSKWKKGISLFYKGERGSIPSDFLPMLRNYILGMLSLSLLALALLWYLYVRRAFPDEILVVIDKVNLLLESFGLSNFLILVAAVFAVCMLLTVALYLWFEGFSLRSQLQKIKLIGDITGFMSKVDHDRSYASVVIKLLLFVLFLLGVLQVVKYYWGIGDISERYEFKLSAIEDSRSRLIGNGFVTTNEVNLSLPVHFNSSSTDLVTDAELHSSSPIYLRVTNGDTTSQQLFYSPYLEDFDTRAVIDKKENIKLLSKGATVKYTDLDHLISANSDRLIGIEQPLLRGWSGRVFNETGDYIYWDDLYRSEYQDEVNNDLNVRYDLSGVRGAFEFFTLVGGSKLDIELDFVDLNKRVNLDEVYLTVYNQSGDVVHEQIYGDDFHPVRGDATRYVEKVELDNLEGGIYRIVVGSDIPNGVLLNSPKQGFNSDVMFNAVTLNSNKFVFRPISTAWEVDSTGNFTVKRLDSKIITEANENSDSFVVNSVKGADGIDESIAFSDVGTVAISPKTGSLLRSFYSFYSTTPEAFFYPYKVQVADLELVDRYWLVRGSQSLGRINIGDSLDVSLFTFSGEPFIVSDKVIFELINNPL